MSIMLAAAGSAAAGAIDVNAPFYTGNSVGVTGSRFKFYDSGSLLFSLDHTGSETMYKYSLSTGYDLNTLSSTGQSLDFGTVSNGDIVNAQDIIFKTDGTKVLVVDDFSVAVENVNVSTAWDLSSATDNNDIYILGNDGVTSSVDSFEANPDGTKVFVLNNILVHQYELSTPFGMGGEFEGAHTGFANLDSELSTPAGFTFGDSGQKMLIIEASNNTIYEYDLSVAYVVTSGVTYSGNSFTPSEATVVDIAFNATGTHLIALGGGTLYEYSLPSAYSLAP